MKYLYLMVALLFMGLTNVLSAQHLDGAWLSDKSYGAPGDTVKAEVVAQVEAYTDAKAEAEGIQAGELEGDLRAAQQKCVDTATYSWVQANYLAEMGRLSAVAGKTEQAISDYKSALDAALRAQKANCHEDEKTEKSHSQGLIIEKVIRRALARLGFK